jgi:hypothetical protein
MIANDLKTKTAAILFYAYQKEANNQGTIKIV